MKASTARDSVTAERGLEMRASPLILQAKKEALARSLRATSKMGLQAPWLILKFSFFCSIAPQINVKWDISEL